jgi:hypothetical protein
MSILLPADCLRSNDWLESHLVLVAVYFHLVAARLRDAASPSSSSTIAIRSTENNLDSSRFLRSASSSAFDTFSAGRTLIIATRVKLF